jgi:prolyl oligopeptidase
MKFLISSLYLFVISFSVVAQPYSYPKTRTVNHTDTYFGTEIKDPYRWLEDDHSPETKAWVTEQNIVTENYLSKIPYRSSVKKRMTELWNFPKSSSPSKAGNNYFVYTNDGLQNQFVLNILRGSADATPEVFIDPNTISKDGTINMSSISASSDGKLLAYSVSKAGSDWQEIYIKNTANGNQYNDKIEWVKFSGIAWKDKGFYYSRYDAPDSAEIKKGKNEYHKIYYHHSGNPQKYDRLIYEDKAHPLRNFVAGVSDAEDFLVIYGSEGGSRNSLMVQDLRKVNSPIVSLVDNFENDHSIVDSDTSKFFVLTNAGAPRYRLVMMDAENPKGEWKEIIPEKTEVLQSVVVGNNIFIALYMKDATSLLKMFSKNGTFLGEIPLETIGTADQLSASKKDENLFYSLTSFTSPSVIYRYNLRTKEQQVYFKPIMKFNSDEYETKQVFYKSKDGTSIPMFIVHKKGLNLDGNNPTLLFGYGGFNVSKTPEFKIERLIFLENGGVFAMPCLRGGGEYGEKWHQAGTKLNRQNVFDDCIAAAEYLISEKYTNPSKLGVSGRSNGGLLVGAVMTQRPDLFKVALPTVGVLDMLRYHKFTIGWAWKGDYGSSDNEVEFKYLLSYSPLHNIKDNVDYPATLVITGDHDDRVVPAHSFKFIATLQEKDKGKNPQLIRIDIDAGHASASALGSSKPVSKQIDEQSDIFTFLMYNLGISLK